MSNHKIKISSNRSFGVVFFLFFLIISIWPLFYQEQLRYWSLILSIIFLVLGLINSKILAPFNKVWFKFGILLGNIISPIVMGMVFFLVVTPTAIILRMINKDLLNLKFNKSISYWIEKPKEKSKMKNQF